MSRQCSVMRPSFVSPTGSDPGSRLPKARCASRSAPFGSVHLTSMNPGCRSMRGWNARRATSKLAAMEEQMKCHASASAAAGRMRCLRGGDNLALNHDARAAAGRPTISPAGLAPSRMIQSAEKMAKRKSTRGFAGLTEDASIYFPRDVKNLRPCEKKS